MEFVILVLALIDPSGENSGASMAVFPTHAECEDVKRAYLEHAKLSLPPEIELRARCVSTEALLPSI